MRFPQASNRDTGSATAEFAVVVPSVLALCVVALGAAVGTAQQIRVVDAAAVAARAAGRGESIDIAAGMLAGLSIGSVTSSAEGPLVCVTIEAAATLAASITVPLRARSCAAADGG